MATDPTEQRMRQMEHAALAEQPLTEADLFSLPEHCLAGSPLLAGAAGDIRYRQGRLHQAARWFSIALKGFGMIALPAHLESAMCSFSQVLLRLGALHEAETLLHFLKQEYDRPSGKERPAELPLALAAGSRLVGGDHRAASWFAEAIDLYERKQQFHHAAFALTELLLRSDIPLDAEQCAEFRWRCRRWFGHLPEQPIHMNWIFTLIEARHERWDHVYTLLQNNLPAHADGLFYSHYAHMRTLHCRAAAMLAKEDALPCIDQLLQLRQRYAEDLTLQHSILKALLSLYVAKAQWEQASAVRSEAASLERYLRLAPGSDSREPASGPTGRTPEQAAERASGHASERMPEYASGHASEHTSERASGHTSERTPEYVSGHASERTPEYVSERTPEYVSERTPEHASGHASEPTSEHAPGHGPGRIPASSEAAWKVQLFGGLLFLQAGRAVRQLRWRRKKALELCLYLFLQPRYSCPKEQIIDQLQLGEDPAKANPVLNVIVHQLKLTLQEQLSISGGVSAQGGIVALREDAFEFVDIERYLALIRIADQLWRKDPSLSCELYQEACALYDEPIPEFPYFSWLDAYKTFLLEKQTHVLRRLSLLAYERNDPASEEFYGKEWIRLCPYQEEAYDYLIRLLLRMNRRVEAEQWYRQFAAVCQEELGTEPSKHLRYLFEGGAEQRRA